MAGENQLNAMQRVRDYMREHRLEQLFANATTALMHEQPDDPKKFLADFFRSVMAARDGNMPSACPSVISDDNIASMFDTIDVNNTGYITFKQYVEVMRNLGITTFNRDPVGKGNDKIGREIFIQEAKAGLVESTATYAGFLG